MQVGIERCLPGDVMTLQWIPAAISQPVKTAIPANKADGSLIFDEAVGLGPSRATKHRAVSTLMSKKRIPPFLTTNASVRKDIETIDDILAIRASVRGFGTGQLPICLFGGHVCILGLIRMDSGRTRRSGRTR